MLTSSTLLGIAGNYLINEHNSTMNEKYEKLISQEEWHKTKFSKIFKNDLKPNDSNFAGKVEENWPTWVSKLISIAKPIYHSSGKQFLTKEFMVYIDFAETPGNQILANSVSEIWELIFIVTTIIQLLMGATYQCTRTCMMGILSLNFILNWYRASSEEALSLTEATHQKNWANIFGHYQEILLELANWGSTLTKVYDQKL